MKRLIVITITILIAHSSFSQTDYRKGYVITNARDTLFGLIDYREGLKAYKSCDFKNTKDQNTTTYEPRDIVGYGFENDKFFQTKEISVKGQPSKVVFLEVIIRSLVSLYRFENIYFIEKHNNNFQQLINETSELLVDGKRVLKSTNQHISTMNILLFECAEIREKIQQCRLNEKSLTNLIEDYNRCKGESSTAFKAKKPWTKAIVGVTSGVNISKLNFYTGFGFEHLEGVLEVSRSPVIGISMDILSPKLSERISLHGDLLYVTSNYYNYTILSNGSFTQRNYVTIELHQLKIPMGIRYTFPKRNFTPYLNIGISNTIHLKSNSIWIQEVESNNVVATNKTDALSIEKNQLGLWGGFGILKG